jgi:CxxC motif-containing protein (DUF1111 family)
MPHRHPSALHQAQHAYPGRNRPPRGRSRTMPILLSALLPALLAACGSGSSDPAPPGAQSMSMSGSMSKMAGDISSETALTPVAASASASERGDLSAAAAIDYDDTTRWSSGFTDDQWLTLDYGQSVTINRVRIAWENAHALAYQLQVSDDNAHWTTIKDVTGSTGGTEDFSGLSGQGRYLRLQGVKRSTQYGYSVFEIQAFSGTPVSTTPPPTTTPVDTSKPGVAVAPVQATASSDENGGMAASMAIDGKPNTRWSSTAQDGAWIQFDFGSKTQVGYMKLTWENAYGKEYALQVSDDGQTWTQLRYVSDGKGGTEEFFNLNANARFIRLQGVARATQYGYSLFEVEFKTLGSDNTLPSSATTALRFPANGSGLAPLPPANPIETLQFSLPDGTLVTRFGARALARHGRERGEEWNEIGYGPNETVDPASGLPVDKGPGNYLTFVPHYFQHRTWGIEIIDNSRVAGVTKPTLVYNQYTQVDFLPGQVAFFRGFDRPGVTGYGWMNPGELVDNSVTVCHPVAYPAAGQLTAPGGINGACTLRIKDYPGHADLAADGFPNGKNVNARPLVVGDVIEVAPSMFAASSTQMATDGDNGNVRYYGPEWVYVVGTGLRPWYGVQPRLNSVPLPDDTLSGGLGSVSYNYSDNALFMFQQPQNNVGMQNAQRFVEGRRLVHSSFTTGAHNEDGNTPYLPIAGLQGAHFNQSVCIACHVNNGRSAAATGINQKLDTMSVRVAATGANGAQVPHPQYGTAIQMNGLASTGTTRNWGNDVRVGAFATKTVKLADGTVVELRKPTLAFEGPVPDIYSLRAAQPMIGTGLLEAVAEADILARARTTPDADGVKGVANFVFDPESGAVRLGRFGWKAGKSTLRHQTAEALLLDMGVTSPVYPNRACMTGPAGCASGGVQPGISESDLQSISHYLSLVAVPAQRSLASGFPKGVAPIDELRVDPVQVGAGARLFAGMRCTACHTAEMKTGSGHLFAELRNQTIHPYSDLLLHDLGDGLADKFAEGQARGGMWRTAPLWGIGYTDKVLGSSTKVGYLHDGRARTLTEAIMWHGGEATVAQTRFANLSKTDRDALLAFLKSL